MQRDSMGQTFTVAAILCVVCSVLVSAAAVGLRPLQLANKEKFQRQNILAAAGISLEGTTVDLVAHDERSSPELVSHLEAGSGEHPVVRTVDGVGAGAAGDGPSDPVVAAPGERQADRVLSCSGRHARRIGNA